MLEAGITIMNNITEYQKCSLNISILENDKRLFPGFSDESFVYKQFSKSRNKEPNLPKSLLFVISQFRQLSGDSDGPGRGAADKLLWLLINHFTALKFQKMEGQYRR